MSKIIIGISGVRGIPLEHLKKLAKQTSLPLLDRNIQPEYILHLTREYLELQKVSSENKNKKVKTDSIHIEFLQGKTRHRRLQGGGKGQDIAKAIGMHKINNPTVLDLTTGLGGDAFVLASLGCDVTMLERNPIVHALLNDALQRASLSADHEMQDILSRMNLKNEEAIKYISTLEGLPDVIYLDPMFPTRTKSAQVKKEMQFLHDIVGKDDDSENLLLLALEKATKRIVVKRPRLAEKLTEELEPAFVISGKSTRYDVYLPLS
ncbi:MAG: class I SAM-dependent methyltransferase [Cocleimonas sp.]